MPGAIWISISAWGLAALSTAASRSFDQASSARLPSARSNSASLPMRHSYRHPRHRDGLLEQRIGFQNRPHGGQVVRPALELRPQHIRCALPLRPCGQVPVHRGAELPRRVALRGDRIDQPVEWRQDPVVISLFSTARTPSPAPGSTRTRPADADRPRPPAARASAAARALPQVQPLQPGVDHAQTPVHRFDIGHFSADHNRSAIAASRGHSFASRFSAVAISSHIAASPPRMSWRSASLSPTVSPFSGSTA